MRNPKMIAAFCAAALLTGQVLYLPSPIVTEERVCAYLEDNYGQIGNAVFWEYRSEIGTLTIYGEGPVDEREYYPWTELADPSLTQIIVENGVTNIPAGMFQGLSYVMDAEIAGTVTSIGANAFKDCTNLFSIELPGALTTLSGTAFDGTNITELHLPSALLGITDNYFSGCTWLESISGQSTGYYADGDALYTADKTKLLWHSDARNDSIFIPEGVTEIGAGVFQYDYIYQLNLPASLTLVGENAFYDCQITEVIFAGTQTQWDALSIMTGNGGLTSAPVTCTGTEPEDPTVDYLAYGTENGLPWTLTHDGILTISPNQNGRGELPNYEINGYSATWEYCEIHWGDPAPPWSAYQDDITAIVIEEGVMGIGAHAFMGLHGLKSVSLPASLAYIGEQAFTQCRYLETVTIPENSDLMELGDEAFSAAMSLKAFPLPEGLRSIGYECFYWNALTNVHIPASVKAIGEKAFDSCDDLESITVAEENGFFASYDGALYSKDMTTVYRYPQAAKTKQIIVPDSVRTIEGNAFSDCINVVNIWLPDGITEIKRYTFTHCDKLTYIRLPETLTTLGYAPFSRCFDLHALYLPESLTSIDPYNDKTYLAYKMFYEGSPAQWAQIEGVPETPDYELYTNAQPCDYFTCDIDSDSVVDATEASRLLQFAAAEGSGYDKGYAHYWISQGILLSSVSKYGQYDDSVPLDTNDDGSGDAADAALILQYAAAAGSGYEDGFAAYLSERT